MWAQCGVWVSTLWLAVSGRSRRWLCSLGVTFSMRSRHSALSIQSMASHWIPSLWGQRHSHHVYIYKYKQGGRHNGCIVQHEHVMKWAMSKLLAHYTRKQLSVGETEPIPNLWQFACIVVRRPNPHRPPIPSSPICLQHMRSFVLFPMHTSIMWRNGCLWLFSTCCTPAAPVRRCACWSTPGVSRWRSWC